MENTNNNPQAQEPELTIRLETEETPKGPQIPEAEAFRAAEVDTEKEANNFLKGFLNFVKNGDMDKTAKEVSAKTGLPPRIVAKNFALKVLGVLSDVLHLAIDTTGDVVVTLINVLGQVLILGAELIMRVAKRLVRIVTLNQTARATA